MQKFYDCGIDLGTTNSCLAIPDDNHGFIVIDNQMDRMSVTPSAVEINSKGRIRVGQRAYNSLKTEDLALQFKRQMGTDKKIHFESANLDKTPEELSAEILKSIKNDAEKRLNRAVENVVITVPAAFKTLQSEATNKAGKLAGFKNIILLQEPIAAAVAYGAQPNSKDQYWMVFDYGGGTLDVAIVSTMNGKLTVKWSEGDNYFGGSDIDRLIYNKIVLPKLQEDYCVDSLLDETTDSGKSNVRKILLDCESCKIALSKDESYTYEYYDIDDDEGNSIEFECDITKAEFESLISPTIDRTIEIAEKTLDGAGIKAENLDKILLVGGSTYIPLVRKKLTEAFNVPLDSSLDPMTVVAGGAAIYASTSVFDEDEDLSNVKVGEAVISLTYDSISSEENVDVIGKIQNIDDVSVNRIRIDCVESDDDTGAIWTSGLVELLDQENGVFDVEVKLSMKGKLNHFKLHAFDNKGAEIQIKNPYFDIKHNENVLRNAAPPATASIGVEIVDPETGYDVIDVVIHKNDELPASREKTYKLSRDFDPLQDDVIAIKIFEGENFENPKANTSAGEITIHSSAMTRPIPKGTEIDLTITANPNRNITVTGYIPDFDYEIPEKTLRPESRVDLEERMNAVEESLKKSERSLQELSNVGVDVTEYRDELDQIKAAYDDVYDMLDSDEATVNKYIDRFYDLETKIIAEERKHSQNKKHDEVDENVSRSKDQVEQFGDEEDREQLEELEESYQEAETPEEKKYISDKMSNIGTKAMLNNFDFLRGIFLAVLAKPETLYVNDQKAEYWKSQAYQGIEDENINQLRKADLELLGLLQSGASDAIATFTSDLTK